MRTISSSRTDPRRRRRAIAGALAGAVLGVAAGLATLTITAGLALGGASEAPSLDPSTLIDAAHVPPLLTAGGEDVELRYDVYCAAPGDDPESGAPCDAEGTVFVRARRAGLFRSVPLRLEARTAEGRYVAAVPADVAASPGGFSYYAVLRNRHGGASMTLPAGGAAAPHRSQPLGEAVTVELGEHRFGRVRRPSERMLFAPWGAAPDEVGLEGGRQTASIGPAAFDVEGGGALVLLDQVNRRLVRVEPDGRRALVPVGVRGSLADLAVGTDGTVFVLESASEPGHRPLLRVLGADGRQRQAVEVAERTAAQVRAGPHGPVVKQYPAEQWLPVLERGEALDRAGQARRGRTGRPLADGREVTVLRDGNELRLALAGPGGLRRSWVVRSETDMAEVQLAEPLGNRLVAVVRLYTDDRDEFAALVLGARGVEQQFSLDSADWAETAPLARFRLAGRSLYQLGSTPAGAHVDRFDLEVDR